MSTPYDFYGRHLLLNFSGCQNDLDNLEQIKRDMVLAVETVGAHILSVLEHKFDPHGVSVVLMLSESHASIHTYPEHQACFLDIFTCGRSIFVEPFGEVLEQMWQPSWVSKKLVERFDPALQFSQESSLVTSTSQPRHHNGSLYVPNFGNGAVTCESSLGLKLPMLSRTPETLS